MTSHQRPRLFSCNHRVDVHSVPVEELKLNSQLGDGMGVLPNLSEGRGAGSGTVC